MSNILGIAHVAIQAEDFNKVILFYTKALDFNIIHEWSLPEFHLKNAAMLKSPDGKSMIEIFDNEADIAGQGRRRCDGEDFIKGSLLHFAINVKDIKLAFDKAISYGAKECLKPSKIILGDKNKVVENALVYSPNGEVIEFIKESIF